MRTVKRMTSLNAIQSAMSKDTPRPIEGPKLQGRPRKFEETHVRFTGYLTQENDATLRGLVEHGQIRSMTRAINAALEIYLAAGKFTDSQ